MKIYDNLRDPSVDLNTFIRTNWATLPAEVQEEVIARDGPGNEQDRNAYVIECMYAHRTEPGIDTNEARSLMASIAFYYGSFGLLYFRDGRGERMANALRRDNGEEGYNQPVELDPEAIPQFQPVPEQPVVLPPEVG